MSWRTAPTGGGMTDRFRPDAALLPLMPPEERELYCAAHGDTMDPIIGCYECARTLPRSEGGVLDDDWQDHCSDPNCEICAPYSGFRQL